MLEAVDSLLQQQVPQMHAVNVSASQNTQIGPLSQSSLLPVASSQVLEPQKHPDDECANVEMIQSLIPAPNPDCISPPNQRQQQQGECVRFHEEILPAVASPRMPTYDELASALGYSHSYIGTLKKKGMPMHSIEAAQKWNRQRWDERSRREFMVNHPTASVTNANIPCTGPISQEQHVHQGYSQDSFNSDKDQMKQHVLSLTSKRLVILGDGTQYEGECSALGKFHGRGKLTFACGDTYFGEFSDGLKNGSGTYIYGNQSFYNGQWSNGLKHGSGVSVYKTSGGVENYTWSAGDIFDGNFAENKRHGPCEYTWFNGQKMHCVWKDGLCPEWSQRNAEILQSISIHSRDPATAQELCTLDTQSLKSSSEPSSSPPPARRPAGIYQYTPSPLKRIPPIQDSRRKSKCPRGMDENGWYVVSRAAVQCLIAYVVCCFYI
jgi:hypothetical protein